MRPLFSTTHTAWWYGRAIRLYFLFSLLISALWIIKFLYIDSFNTISPTTSKPTGLSYQLQNKPSRQYSLAFTDHIYCLNQPNNQGRRARITELLKYMHLDAEIFSHKHATHLDIWRDMISQGYSKALIIEDDVDFELGAHKHIHTAIDALNQPEYKDTWDILYLGHCSMEERQGTKITKHLYKSIHPFCTSGYIVSLQGAHKLYSYFSQHFQPTHALDVQIVALIKRKLIQSLSMFPPLVYQRRDLYPSDDGQALKVFKLLRNSVWDEARLFVPHLQNWQDPPDSNQLDPAYKLLPKWMEVHPHIN